MWSPMALCPQANREGSTGPQSTLSSQISVVLEAGLKLWGEGGEKGREGGREGGEGGEGGEGSGKRKF